MHTLFGRDRAVVEARRKEREGGLAPGAGRGFGVVAAGVKSLALRSLALSTEMAALVAETQIKIEDLKTA